MNCGNQQHSSVCRCDLDQHGNSRVSELEQALSAAKKGAEEWKEKYDALCVNHDIHVAEHEIYEWRKIAESAEAERDELKTVLKSLEGREYPAITKLKADYEKYISALKAERDRYKEALEYYANEDNYGCYWDSDDEFEIKCNVEIDGGKQARESLAKKEV